MGKEFKKNNKCFNNIFYFHKSEVKTLVKQIVNQDPKSTR